MWLGVFFPKSDRAIPQYKDFAQKLLDDLENFNTTTLKDLPENEAEDEQTRQEKSLEHAYKTLWDINYRSKQHKDMLVRLFHLVIGAVTPMDLQTLCEAVPFNLPNKDHSDYRPLTREQLQDLYCNFLKPNYQGCLDFEHLSAEVFIRTFEDPDNQLRLFDPQRSSRLAAEMAVKAFELTDHKIWNAAGIQLDAWGQHVDEDFESHSCDGPSSCPVQNTRLIGYHNPDHFGFYICRNFVHQCRELKGNDKHWIVQRLRDLIQRQPRSGFETWVLIRAHTNSVLVEPGRLARNSLRRTPDGRGILVDPLQCVLSYGFSPLSRDASGCPSLLPGFSLNNSSEPGSDRNTALHIICKEFLARGAYREDARNRDTCITSFLQAFECAIPGSSRELLLAQDTRGNIPLHNFYSDPRMTEVLLRAAHAASISLFLVAGDDDSGNMWNANADGAISVPVEDLLRMSRDMSSKRTNDLVRLFDISESALGSAKEALLYVAISWNRLELVRFFLESGAMVNYEDEDHGPALHEAATLAAWFMTEFLLLYGAKAKSEQSPILSPMDLPQGTEPPGSLLWALLPRGVAIGDYGEGYGSSNPSVEELTEALRAYEAGTWVSGTLSAADDVTLGMATELCVLFVARGGEPSAIGLDHPLHQHMRFVEGDEDYQLAIAAYKWKLGELRGIEKD